jgi:hypothetical protein
MRTTRLAGAAVLLALLAATGGARAAEDESVVQEVLGILRERGLVDQEEYERLALKNASYEKKQKESLLSKIQWSGDARVRLENFWNDEDEAGSEIDDRSRFRYRLRVGALAPIHEYVDAGFRLASGEDDIRSTNQSAGQNDPDFDPDSIFIDQAYVTLKAPSDWFGEGSTLRVTGGKIANPFLWRNGKDYMLWDPDINPEGIGVSFGMKPTELVSLYANTGYFILDENSSARDPHVLGVQGGIGFAPTATTELGGRATWYEWHSLDTDFFGRAQGFDSGTGGGGNLDGGLTEGGVCAAVDTDVPPDGELDACSGSSGGSFGAGELAAYFKWAGLEGWPILVFGHYARNFDAESGGTNLAGDAGAGASDEDTGWGAGVEVGDKKEYALLGAGYYAVEANFWPAQFTDSDLFDGFTNRKGWTVYAVRQIFTNTDLSLELFHSEAIEDDFPPFDESLLGVDPERYRLRTDVQVKF